MITIYEIIEREKISDLIFPAIDVLDSEEAIQRRNDNIKRTLALKVLTKNKAKIYFSDNISTKVVETKIKKVTDNKIELKSGITIPIHRIIKFL